MEYKEDSKLCIVIIPGAGKVKRIVIPKWLPKFIIGFTIVISIFLLSIITKSQHLPIVFNLKTWTKTI